MAAIPPPFVIILKANLKRKHLSKAECAMAEKKKKRLDRFVLYVYVCVSRSMLPMALKIKEKELIDSTTF